MGSSWNTDVEWANDTLGSTSGAAAGAAATTGALPTAALQQPNPMVTSYGDVTLEHSLQGATLGKLSQTLSTPSAASTDNEAVMQALSHNHNLLNLVLSQRRTKGQVVQLGQDPKVVVPGIGTFSFSLKSVKKDFVKRIRKGAKVEFKLSQTHPPKAIALRIAGEAHELGDSVGAMEVCMDETAATMAGLSLTTPNGNRGAIDELSKTAPSGMSAVERRHSAPGKVVKDDKNSTASSEPQEWRLGNGGSVSLSPLRSKAMSGSTGDALGASCISAASAASLSASLSSFSNAVGPGLEGGFKSITGSPLSPGQTSTTTGSPGAPTPTALRSASAAASASGAAAPVSNFDMRAASAAATAAATTVPPPSAGEAEGRHRQRSVTQAGDVDAILAEIIDLTDSPVTGPQPPPQGQQQPPPQPLLPGAEVAMDSVADAAAAVATATATAAASSLSPLQTTAPSGAAVGSSQPALSPVREVPGLSASATDVFPTTGSLNPGASASAWTVGLGGIAGSSTFGLSPMNLTATPATLGMGHDSITSAAGVNLHRTFPPPQKGEGKKRSAAKRAAAAAAAAEEEVEEEEEEEEEEAVAEAAPAPAAAAAAAVADASAT
eukprot:Rhum_TRINITY_DN14611_c29_g1::Rhum_TRINITY_DN14611_c29_g1_i1::g.103480::m.103480